MMPVVTEPAESDVESANIENGKNKCLRFLEIGLS